MRGNFSFSFFFLFVSHRLLCSVKAWTQKRKGNTSADRDAELEDILAQKKKTRAALPDSVKYGKQGRGNKKKEYKLQKFAQKTGRKGGWKRNDAASTYAPEKLTSLPKRAGKRKPSKRPNPAARKNRVLKKGRK